jgi:hypothetical protein
VASACVQLSREITEQFTLISSYAHSEKVTTNYALYLECLQNDDNMVTDISRQLDEQFSLSQQVLVQDWSSSSVSTMLVSLEEGSVGTILDVNATCASLFGYQKQSLVSHSLRMLMPDHSSSQ